MLLALRGLKKRGSLGLLSVLSISLLAMVLTGALSLGDSMRSSLKKIALSNIGKCEFVLQREAGFKDNLSQRLSASTPLETSSLLRLRGTLKNESGSRLNDIQICGVQESFWKFTEKPKSAHRFKGGACINEELAKKLSLKVGDEIFIRVEKPEALSRESTLSSKLNLTVAKRFLVEEILPAEHLGNFKLTVGQQSIYNVFVDLSDLQKLSEKSKRANTLLIMGQGTQGLAYIEEQLDQTWDLEDVGLKLKEHKSKACIQLESDSVFIDKKIGERLNKIPGSDRIFSYFASKIFTEKNETPYSMVSALSEEALKNEFKLESPLLKGEVLVSSWLAEDLGLSPKSEIKMNYFEASFKNGLIEKESTFIVRSVVPMEWLKGEEMLMPNFPGLSGVEDCKDWNPAIPVKAGSIRKKDEDYWAKYAGTPKILMSLGDADRLFANNFGNATAYRFAKSLWDLEGLKTQIKKSLNSKLLGFQISPLKKRALDSVSGAQDFAELFMGFSFFIVLAVVLLSKILASLQEQRNRREAGLLMALGFSKKKIFRLFLTRSIFLNTLGVFPGVLLGCFYTQGILLALKSFWIGAVGTSNLEVSFSVMSLLVGAVLSVSIAIATALPGIFKMLKPEVRDLLYEERENETSLHDKKSSASNRSIYLPLVCLSVVAVVAIIFIGQKGTALFFALGGLALLFSFSLCQGVLKNAHRFLAQGAGTLAGMSLINLARKPKRSLSLIAILSCGVFMIVAVSANRKDPNANISDCSSGSGGFTHLAKTSHPLFRNISTLDGQSDLGINSPILKNTVMIPLRVKEGDDASCLNLNRAQSPEIISLPSKRLGEEKRFTVSKTWTESTDAWSLLREPLGDGVLPIFVDTNTLMWGLKKSLGDIVEVRNDRGRLLKLKIMGVLNSSILQGSLLMDDRVFEENFPSQTGHSKFLLQVQGSWKKVEDELSEALSPYGFSLTSSSKKLAEFGAVENTYLTIFLFLGGLGMLLGSCGMALIVLRNIAERRSELALMRSIGFTKLKLLKMLLMEHTSLFSAAIAIGTFSAFLAVTPMLFKSGAGVPWFSIVSVLSAIFISGLLLTCAGVLWGTKGSLHAPLCHE